MRVRYHRRMLPDSAHSEAPLTGTALHAAKLALRAERMAARDALPPAEHALASGAIAVRLASLPSFAAAHVLLLTLPYRSEWNTGMLFDSARQAGKVIVVPRVDPATRMLDLHAVADIGRDIAPGYRGIPEPAATLPRIEREAIDWVLIPGVAFDLTGRRLGYGGGFYDRLLPLLRPDAPRIAGVFDLQIVERVPATAHDLTVDLMVTETRILAPAARA
jgi:5-formyltetrahydrofolate cyclo-ligase